MKKTWGTDRNIVKEKMKKVEKNFCRRDEQMKNAGDFEFGNIDLSYGYCKRYFKKTSCNSRSFKLLDIGTNRGTLIWKLYQSLQTAASLRKMLQASGFEEIVIEKYSLYSAFNKKKVRKYFGILGPVIMKICSRLPLVLYPNLWGHAINRKK